MQVKNFYLYNLIKSDIPEILRNKVIIRDVNVGGIKLQYEVSTVKALVFKLFNKQKIINLTLFPKDKETKTFLRPYKKNWSKEREKLPKCLWGKNDDVLTNLWIELVMDYKDLDHGEVLLKREIRDTNITKHLSRNKKSFFVFKKQ
jgi:hypothetical protein